MNLLIPELVKIEAKQTLLILHLRKIEAKWILFIPQIRKFEAERTLFIPQIGKSEVCLFHKFEKSKRSEFIPQIGKIEAKSVYSTNSKDWGGANWANSRNRQDRSGKNELDRSKTNRGGIFKAFMEPRNRFQGMDSASLCPGGPVQQPYYNSVLSPLRLF